MKNKTYMLPVALTVVISVILLAIIMVHTFLPAFVIPKVSIPNLVLVSVCALVLDHYLARGAKRNYFSVVFFSLVGFYVLPVCAGYMGYCEGVKVAVCGCAVFTACTFLYTSCVNRMKSGPAACLAPVLTAFGLFLAAQCFQGMIF